jgi:DNA-binding NarL/FixJ family response regulator
METIQLLLVDDERQVRQGLRMRLEMEPDLRVVGEAGDGCAALSAVQDLRPDVVLMDIDMPGKDGIAITAELLAATARCAVVIVSMHDDAATRARAFAAGAFDLVGKHEIDTALIDAIRRAGARLRCERRKEPPLQSP